MLLEKHLDLKPTKVTTGNRLIPLANHYKSSQTHRKWLDGLFILLKIAKVDLNLYLKIILRSTIHH